ncbi:methyltransferase domain-containing protein [Glaciibacter flavus]|uniref:methyltransferase domain-containing protein n=1 Tax=Orlajensenia flava TaxID=2565934 RepID=UPI002E275E13
MRCPVCEKALLPAPPLALRCADGHSFDANKRGFATLVPSNDRMVGDAAAMLDDRAAFLAEGHYSPIAAAVAHAAAGGRAVLDAGCGTGYYLGAVLDAGDSVDALAMDLSPDAVRRTVRATGSVGLVADTWRPLPIRTASSDVVLDVFAPRNLREFHRVLRDDGRLVVVVPTGEHLRELRAAGRAIGIPSDKVDAVVADAAPLFSPTATVRIDFAMTLTGESIDRLVGMGPSAHHRQATIAPETDADATDADATEMTMHASVDVMTLAKR